MYNQIQRKVMSGGEQLGVALVTFFAKKKNRGVGAKWAVWTIAQPLFWLPFIKKWHLPIHFCWHWEWFSVLPTQFQAVSYTPEKTLLEPAGLYFG